MRKLSLFFILYLLCSTLPALLPLEKTYGSGTYQGESVSLLTWSDHFDDLLYWDGSQINSISMQGYDPTSGWIYADFTLPDHPYVGFSFVDGESRINPIFWDAASDPPSSLYATMEDDASGDNLFSDNLDIISYEASFTSDKFHFTLSNATGEYPVNSDMEFFSYMIVLADPNADPNSDPIVYALMYTIDMGTLISPGLYKISGTGIDDLVLIGDITHSVDTQTGILNLSCDIASLTSDPDFSSWYAPQYPLVSTVAMTSRITLTAGNEEADATQGCKVLFKAQEIPVDNQHEPVLSDPQVEDVVVGDEEYLVFSISYADADANFPRLCMFFLDEGEVFPLYPTDLPQEIDFEQAVTYSTDLIPHTPWDEGVFSFSHGDGSITESIINQTPANEEYLVDEPICIYPNPVQSHLLLEVQDRSAGDIQLRLYNARGQKIRDELFISPDTSPIKLDVSAFPAGVYFLNIGNSRGTYIKRFVKVD